MKLARIVQQWSIETPFHHPVRNTSEARSRNCSNTIIGSSNSAAANRAALLLLRPCVSDYTHRCRCPSGSLVTSFDASRTKPFFISGPPAATFEIWWKPQDSKASTCRNATPSCRTIGRQNFRRWLKNKHPSGAFSLLASCATHRV